MKNLIILFVAVLLASCASDQNTSNKANVDNAPAEVTSPTTVTLDANDPNVTVTPPAGDIPQVNIPADKDGNLYHYICEDKCAGSGAADHGDCSVCGKTLAHNQGFHTGKDSQAPQINAGDLPAGLQDLGTVQPNTTTIGQPNQTPEPPQNAKGVWHFTCASGCAGGAGGAIACSNCGTTLLHNASYHN